MNEFVQERLTELTDNFNYGTYLLYMKMNVSNININKYNKISQVQNV